MPRKPTITEASLRSLGPKRLAAFLVEACDREVGIDKKVRLSLDGTGRVEPWTPNTFSLPT